MDLASLVLYGFVAAVIFFIIVCMWVISASERYPSIRDTASERVYSDGERQHSFPSLMDEPSVTLSVVVPAYNEQDRLPSMLDECLHYLQSRSCSSSSGGQSSHFSYEVIVVDDGSTDGTAEVALSYTRRYGADRVRCLQLATNRGKGGAVRMGMLRSRGTVLLFADADGASKFEDYGKLEAALGDVCRENKSLAESLCVACGSRAHMEDDSVAQRSLFRTILMYGFHGLVWLFTVRGVRDTQCGFKLMTRRTARILFHSLHIERWAFDVEMLVIAQSLGIPVAEVAINWQEIEGSKVTPILSWLQMGRDLVLIWLRYKLGAWQIRSDIQ